MRALRTIARALRDQVRLVRVRLWVIRLKLAVRRRGGRAVVEAPYGIQWEEPPLIRARPLGDGDGVTRIKLGRGIKIGRRCVIEIWARGTNVLEIGDEVLIEDDVKLHLHPGSIRVGATSQLRDNVRLKATGGDLFLGERVVLGYLTMLHCSLRMTLEDWVGLSERVTVVDSDHGFDGSDEYFFDAPLKTAPVHFERNAFVAAGCIVMRGTHLGRNAVVAAGAVVTRGDYPGGWLMMGMPAKPFKPLPRSGEAELEDSRSSTVPS